MSKGTIQQHKSARRVGGPARPGSAPTRARRAVAAAAPLPGFDVLPAATAAGDVAAPPRQGWQQAIGTTVSGLGYELVDVERVGRGLLRVTIDRIPGRVYGPPGAPDSGEAITVEDCEAVTRQLQYVLEVEGLDYARLEVSSPGLDRPLRHEADYQRFAGHAVKLTLREPFEGRKHWEGVLGAGDDGRFSLRLVRGQAEQQLDFGLDEVREARLVPVLDFKGRKAQPPVEPVVQDGASSTSAPDTTTATTAKKAKGRTVR